MIEDKLTEKIIGAAYQVHNTLGFGFREKIYQRAMVIALGKMGLEVEEEYPMSIFFEGEKIGRHRADLYVEQKVLVELKAILSLSKGDEVQLVNYLKATGTKTGLLVNFGQSVQIRRKYKDYRPPKPDTS